MSKYKIHPLVVGSRIFDKSMMTYHLNQGTTYTIPIYSWYIEGGDKKILVDTGELNPIVSEDREKAIGGKIYTIEQALARFGLTPADIDIVIHTHLHNDHCENDFKFENAKFYVHKLELEHLHNPHPLDGRYVEDYVYEIEENGQIVVVEGDMEIVPGVRVVHSPAHTEGGLSVLVETGKGVAAISGFCCIAENFYPPKEITAREMEVIPPGIHVNVHQAYDSVVKIKNLADIVLPLHEPKFASGEPIG